MTAGTIVCCSLESQNDISYSCDDKVRELIIYTSIRDKLRK